MDNDNLLKKFLVRTYRKIRLHIDYDSMGLLSPDKGNALIAELLKTSEPFAVCRLGGVEMRCIVKRARAAIPNKMEMDNILFAAGVFPNSLKMVDKFSEIYTSGIRSCDVMAVCEVIGEKNAIKKYCPDAKILEATAIEPYYFNNPWSKFLKDKKVLIIHPFIDSIKKQLEKKDEIWPNREVLPKFKTVSFLKAVQSNAGAESGFTDWFEALEYMKAEIDKIDFDVALIGAGAYSLPLVAHCKSIGKQAIQTAGGTQILFGIKGKRWDNHPIISKFYNDAWIRPSESETPPQTKKVEGGSYW